MAYLNSFGSAIKVAVIGASGGVGRALVDVLLLEPDVHTVYGLARRELPKSLIQQDKFTPLQIALDSESDIEAAIKPLHNTALDLVIVASGLLHSDADQPEKSIRALSVTSFNHLMQVNALAPMLLAKYLLPRMQRQRKAVFAALSARVGSIGDNHLGGWYSYRASKAALNMMLKNLAIEVGRRYPNMVIAGLHPGTVATALSQPFQKNVSSQQLFSPQQSAHYLLQVIDQLSPSESGGVYAWDGRVIVP